MTPAESSRRVHVLTALLLVGTFAAGVVTGAGVLRWAAPSAPTTGPAAPGQPAGPAALAPPLPAARLPRELKLTPEQEARAREIGERYRPELDALAREIRPRIRAVQDRMEGEFLQVLTPEQRDQLARIEERRRHPPPGDGPSPRTGEAPASAGPKGPGGEGRPAPQAGDPRPPPPQEAIDACQHLDLDQLCRFSKSGREHEGSCRRPPDGQGPLSCAPDRHMEPPPEERR
jgi:hypothetical protein